MAVCINDLVDNLEQKIVQQTLRLSESEEKYRQLVEGTEDLIIRVDGEGLITFVNTACEKIYGRDVEACIGQSFFQFIHENDQEEARKKFVECLEHKEEKAVFENRQIGLDGAMHSMTWSANFTYAEDGTVASVDLIGRDITQLREIETTLQREKERAQKYLDVAGVMFVVLDSAGIIRLINQQGCRLLKVTEQEALGQNWFDHYLPEGLRKEVRGVFSKLMAGEQKLVEYYENEILTADGEMRLIAFHNTILRDDDGRIGGVLFSGDDITERKKSEEERARLEAQLFQAHKMEAIGTLAGGIAHDFNNILTAIIGYAEITKLDLPESSHSHSHIDQVLKAGNRAKELVKQILAFSRKGVEIQQPMQPACVIKEAIKLLRASLPTTIAIEEEIHSDCGLILANPTNIHQVLLNLCTNALHAMEGEKGVLTVTLTRVEFTREEEVQLEGGVAEGVFIELLVRDSGHGIDKTVRGRIFEPYFTTKGVGKGSGMGLAMVHGIVQDCGGFIRVQSEPGQGTTFCVYFPALEEGTARGEQDEQVSLSMGYERILIVDDEEAIVGMYTTTLERLGYRVTAYSDSVKTLEAFRVAPERFDLIITDQTMPHIPGSELAKEVLKIRPDIPIILCTGFSAMISEEIVKEIGIERLVLKPLSGADLATIVREVLDKSKFFRTAAAVVA